MAPDADAHLVYLFVININILTQPSLGCTQDEFAAVLKWRMFAGEEDDPAFSLSVPAEPQTCHHRKEENKIQSCG